MVDRETNSLPACFGLFASDNFNFRITEDLASSSSDKVCVVEAYWSLYRLGSEIYRSSRHGCLGRTFFVRASLCFLRDCDRECGNARSARGEGWARLLAQSHRATFRAIPNLVTLKIPEYRSTP